VDLWDRVRCDDFRDGICAVLVLQLDMKTECQLRLRVFYSRGRDGRSNRVRAVDCQKRLLQKGAECNRFMACCTGVEKGLPTVGEIGKKVGALGIILSHS
jgi:hypothetical protein